MNDDLKPSRRLLTRAEILAADDGEPGADTDLSDAIEAAALANVEFDQIAKEGAQMAAQFASTFKGAAQLRESLRSLAINNGMAEEFRRSAIAGIAIAAESNALRGFQAEQTAAARVLRSVRFEAESMRTLTRWAAEAQHAKEMALASLGAAQMATRSIAAFELNNVALQDSIASLMRTSIDVEGWRFATKAAEAIATIFQPSPVPRIDWERLRVELRVFRRELLRFPHAVRAFVWRLPGASTKSPRELRELLCAVLDWLHPRHVIERLRIRFSKGSAILRLDLSRGIAVRQDDHPWLPFRDLLLIRQHGLRAPPLGLGMNSPFIPAHADLGSI